MFIFFHYVYTRVYGKAAMDIEMKDVRRKNKKYALSTYFLFDY